MRARSSHVVLAAGFAFFALTLSSAHATAGAPTDQIKATVDKALVVLKDPRLKPAAKNAKPFRAELYLKNQEYNAGAGFAAGVLFLLLRKM